MHVDAVPVDGNRDRVVRVFIIFFIPPNPQLIRFQELLLLSMEDVKEIFIAPLEAEFFLVVDGDKRLGFKIIKNLLRDVTISAQYRRSSRSPEGFVLL